MQKPKILFILKKREFFNEEENSYIEMQSGLYNSASFVNDMLNESGLESKISVVSDNNCIDKEVSDFKPTHVIVEALWVVPAKFSVLCKLHPNVNWIIRLHSEIPFLANEGMAFDWLGDYASYKNITIAANAPRAYKEISYFIQKKLNINKEQIEKKVIYFPNYYPKVKLFKNEKIKTNEINIGCFGAIRPLKNHLNQAIAAIMFADKIGKKLIFHINSGRVEMKGEPILRNLQSLFLHLESTGHEMKIHDWLPRQSFLSICGSMDIGMQCSISETFNIVAADLIKENVPIVGSKEIPWLNRFFGANPTKVKTIYCKLLLAYYLSKVNIVTNQIFLNIYTNKTKKILTNYFKNN